MAKQDNGTLAIKDFHFGIAPSPHLGIADMRNADIYNIPGIARSNFILAKRSSTTITAMPKWFRRNPRNTAEVWALDETGKTYKSTDSGATWSYVSGGGSTNADGNGLEIAWDYLFVFRRTKIDVYGPLSSSPAWTNDWQTIDSDDAFHPAIVSKNDGKIYAGAGKYVLSIEQVSTFDPATAATYTFTAQALDLPTEYRIKCLAELGVNLMIGTWKGTAIYDFKTADIFPWSRSTTESFDLPISLEENGINAMLNINNVLYVLAGVEGKIFTCNGVQSGEVAKIPLAITGIDAGNFIEAWPGAVMQHQGRFFFGISCGASNFAPGMGVWSLLLTEKKNILTYENQISTNNDGTSTTVKIGALLSLTREVYAAGWKDATTYGVDTIDNTNRYASFGVIIDSPLFQVGTTEGKRTFSQSIVELVKKIPSGCQVRLKWRANLTDSFTTLDTFSNSSHGLIISRLMAGIADLVFAQIRIELTSSGTSTPELRTVRLV